MKKEYYSTLNNCLGTICSMPTTDLVAGFCLHRANNLVEIYFPILGGWAQCMANPKYYDLGNPNVSSPSP